MKKLSEQGINNVHFDFGNIENDFLYGIEERFWGIIALQISSGRNNLHAFYLNCELCFHLIKDDTGKNILMNIHVYDILCTCIHILAIFASINRM